MPSRIRKVNVATVLLWDRVVGAVAWNQESGRATFEYDSVFVKTGIEVSPLVMPLRPQIFSFPELSEKTFRGLPGLLADSLPDRFGNKLIDLWLQQQGRSLADFSPVARLCYIASRGMGALEFKPALTRQPSKTVPLEIAQLTRLVQQILADRENLVTNLRAADDALKTIIRIGTSAGGARAKAVIAWNPVTEEIRSGQISVPEGFEHWILKFDGVKDEALGEPEGYGRIEYAYHLMALDAGIEMTACRLLEEGGRAHFMTKRFDRDGGKIHMQSLCALAHYDFNSPGAYGYEQALTVIQQLNLGHVAMNEMFRRMVFNVIARNQDDHTRNIAFLMDTQGRWRLAPAFDVMWAYNPGGPWTNQHQMRINGKTDGFQLSDIIAVADEFGMHDGLGILAQVRNAVGRWPAIAAQVGVPGKMIDRVRKSHRLSLA